MKSKNDMNKSLPIVAGDLLAEFLTDELIAAEKYTGRKITLTGTVSSMARPKDFIPPTDVCYIVFSVKDGNSLLNSDDGVLCYFDYFAVDFVHSGDSITVKGNFRGFRDNGVFKTVILGECELLDYPRK